MVTIINKLFYFYFCGYYSLFYKCIMDCCSIIHSDLFFLVLVLERIIQYTVIEIYLIFNFIISYYVINAKRFFRKKYLFSYFYFFLFSLEK